MFNRWSEFIYNMNKNILKIQYSARNKRLKNNDMTYQEFLKSDIWKQTKEYVKQFPEFNCCFVCSSTIKLNIHHMTYTKMFDKSLKKRKQGLICLCNTCHNGVHIISQDNNYGLRQAIKKYKRARL